MGAARDEMRKRRRQELKGGEAGGKIELLSRVKWKMGGSKLRVFHDSTCMFFYKGAVLPSALRLKHLTF